MERCFFRRPNFLSFNRPHTRLKITGGSGGGGACRAAGRPGRRPAQAAPLPRGRQTRANPHELASNEESTRICCGRACWNGTGTASNPASWNGSGRNIHKYAKNMQLCVKLCLKYAKYAGNMLKFAHYMLLYAINMQLYALNMQKKYANI